MTIVTAEAAPRRTRLVVEFVLLYLTLPVAMALVMPPRLLWPVFFGVTLVSLALLAATPGFRWRELGRGWRRLDGREVAVIAAGTAVACGVLVLWLVPDQALRLPRRAPRLWLAILVLYPLLSAMPQEVVFRLLFFRRYGALFGDRTTALTVNAAVFALVHLLFWNPVAPVLTFAGGLLFARGYLGRGGFPMAVLLHAICGLIVFSSGLGSFFYHGAIR